MTKYHHDKNLSFHVTNVLYFKVQLSSKVAGENELNSASPNKKRERDIEDERSGQSSNIVSWGILPYTFVHELLGIGLR